MIEEETEVIKFSDEEISENKKLRKVVSAILKKIDKRIMNKKRTEKRNSKKK